MGKFKKKTRKIRKSKKYIKKNITRRKKKYNAKKKYMRGGQATTVIDAYLTDLYKEGKPNSFDKCYFACNLQEDTPSFCGAVINEKYRRAHVGVKKLLCGDKVGRDQIKDDDVFKKKIKNKNCVVNYNAIKQIADNEFPKNYFQTIRKQGEGHDYFHASYKKYFGYDYGEKGQDVWNNVINKIVAVNEESTYKSIDNGNETIIILGPAEILAPFSSNLVKFNVLSHATWTPNVNFNYIIDVLCKKGSFFFVLPTGQSNAAISKYELAADGTKDGKKVEINRFSLASNCEGFIRATLSELLIAKELENSGLVKVTKFEDNFRIPNDHLDPTTYDLTILHVEAINKDTSLLCQDTIISAKPIDYSK